MPEEAVSNSGPLIHLAQINRFYLLDIFSRIYIPTEVYSEISAFDVSMKHEVDKAKNIEKIDASPNDLTQLIKRLKRYNLDLGELQAIFLCQKLGQKLFLTDDLDAREAALEIGMEPHGSVGVIVLAYKKGYIDLKNAEKAMHDLYEISNLFITESVIDFGIAELRKYKR